MIDKQPNELATPSGAAQIPVTSADQLHEGLILTGKGWQTVRRIVAVDGRSIHTVKLPYHVPAEHVHNLDRGSCGCSYRVSLIDPPAAAAGRTGDRKGILPQNGVVRTYIIEPMGRLEELDRWTVYRAASWVVIAPPDADGMWQQLMHVIPQLEPVWTVPQEMRFLLTER